DRLGEQLAARDLDPELALQPEDDVQEVDRLGPQVALERGRRLDVFLIHVQRLDQRRGHLLVNFAVRQHRISPRVHRDHRYQRATRAGTAPLLLGYLLRGCLRDPLIDYRFWRSCLVLCQRRKGSATQADGFEVLQSLDAANPVVAELGRFGRRLHDSEQTLVARGAHVAFEVFLGLPFFHVEEHVRVADLLVNFTPEAARLHPERPNERPEDPENLLTPAGRYRNTQRYDDHGP